MVVLDENVRPVGGAQIDSLRISRATAEQSRAEQIAEAKGRSNQAINAPAATGHGHGHDLKMWWPEEEGSLPDLNLT